MEEPWTSALATDLCREIEKIAPLYGAHVALTGGCLYKTGQRKDVDILFYRVRQAPRIEIKGLFEELETELGIKRVSGCGWCIKAETKDGMKIDFFVPEESKVDDPIRDERLREEYGDA